jgi:phage/plasmid primase-like uncharacterized protein
MDAETLTRTLGGRWNGRSGLASCPVPGHGKGLGDRHPSLSISAGKQQAVVVHCHGGCSQVDVIAWLKANGLWHWAPTTSAPRTPQPQSLRPDPRIALAFRLWSRARPLAGTPAAAFLESRGLITETSALGFLPAERFDGIPAVADGAMIAALRSRGGEVRAVQLTYLTSEGHKANALPVRQTYGPMGGLAVQLAACGQTLGIAEGVETALSASLLHNVPVWAVCGRRVGDVPIPFSARNLILFADHDPPGMEAASKALATYRSMGLRVAIKAPQLPGQDWNDVLRARAEA